MRLNFLNSHFFEKVNHVVQETSRIRSNKIHFQVTTVPNLKVREYMVFSTKDQKLKKLELFKVPVLLAITVET